MFKMTLSFMLLFNFAIAVHAAEESPNQQFDAKESQALKAEQMRVSNVADLWTELALSEIGAGRTFKGLEHERRAMNLYSATDVKVYGVFGHLGNSFIRSLIGSGHSAEAEQLLVAAVERTKAVTGPKSVATQAQTGDLFAFYLSQKNYFAALNRLSDVLDFDLSNGEAPSQSSMHYANVKIPAEPQSSVAVLQGIVATIKSNEKTEPSFFVITAFEKILKAQEACLNADDERLVATLAALGDAYYKTEKYKVADGYYSRAYEIGKEYYPGAFGVQQCGQNFLANLKEIGRTEAADRLSKLKWEGTHIKPYSFPLAMPPHS